MSPPTPASLWGPLGSVSLMLLTLLTPTESKSYVWEFQIRETFTQNGKATTHIIGTANCPLAGCSQPITIPITPKSIEKGPRPYACFPYAQTQGYCNQHNYNIIYGGCPYWSCRIHDAYNEAPHKGTFYISSQQFYINVADPWDIKWVAGVQGKLYYSGWSRYPIGAIEIHREYVLLNTTFAQVSIDIAQAEQSLSNHLAQTSATTTSHAWLQILQQTLQFLNQMQILPEISRCFLCASLNRPLLAAVPINLTQIHQHSPNSCHITLKNIPLWEPESENLPYPLKTCYLTHITVKQAKLQNRCQTNVTIHNTTRAPEGQYFWCNETLIKCLNPTTPGPCFLVTIVPQLTLYGESELAWLLPPLCSKRAAFLPILVGISLTTSVAASATAGGALGHNILTSQNFETRLQVALESTAKSLSSLHHQLTSLAQVTLQNRWALDLLTAEKGGTCIFLQEECCYYINESGLVEQNIQTLNKLKEDFYRRKQETSSALNWFSSPPAAWLLPLLGPVILICLFFLLAPCLLNFLQGRIKELSRVAVNQMLLHHLLPTSPNSYSQPLLSPDPNNFSP
ncbi:endogenous retrovirus group FC1 Env polyprotein [Tamandua tetradactyla]|uniref:endogenous retrovirus group FC1 Env polyprotein n=1 Tax=Tamandua tetradactyla TaxID=48850 RepID=UPI0040539C74